jgi:import inner membrane translocase subunit TIM13
MDSLGAAGMSAFPNDPKTQVMRQVQQEAAMQNARMLVEVRFYELRLGTLQMDR